MPQFLITGSGMEPKHWPFPDADIIVIGRGRSSDIFLSDSSRKVSQSHAAVIRIPGREYHYFVRDLGSRHSVKVGGESVYQRLLQDGDRIQIADYHLLFNSQESGANSRPRIRVVDLKDSGGVAGKTVQYHDLWRDSSLDPVANEILDQVLYLRNRGGPAAGLFQEFMSRMLRYLAADRGFVGIFVSGETLEYDECASVGLGVGEEIEIADPLFLGRLQKKEIVQDDTSLLVPIYCAGRVKGFFCVDRLPPAEPFHPDHISFLLKVGELVAGRSECSDDSLLPIEDLREWSATLVGRTKRMRDLRLAIQTAVESDMSVLLHGENGTGKELVANAIHELARGRRGPLIARNCAAIPESLAEAELFGYAEKSGINNADPKGAPGWFEMAHGGTIFLDEIQTLSLPLQNRLLKVLEDKQVWRLGARRPVVVDVKVVAAMDRDPEAAIADGNLRRALADRFDKKLLVPPLRDRRDDIPLLAFYFLDKYASRTGKKTRSVSRRALDLLTQYDWPGNVRELKNCIQNAVTQNTEIILSSDLPPTLLTAGRSIRDTTKVEPRKSQEPRVPPDENLKQLGQIEKEAIERTLRVTGGNITTTAVILAVLGKPL